MRDRSLAHLTRLAALAGVATAYRDAWGQERRTAPAALRAVLGAMGIAAETPRQVEEGIAALAADSWRSLLPPVIVLREAAGPAHVALALPERLNADRILWSVTGEDGSSREGAAEPDALEMLAQRGEGAQLHRRVMLPLVTLPLGYHRLAIAAGDENAESVLIVVPPHGYLPPALAGEQRAWGMTAQLYAVRSAQNWGMGDYCDLGRLAEIAAGRGAKVLGVNPLHALFPGEPRHISPYSPSTRLFLNPLYLEIAAVPDFADCAEAQARVASFEFGVAVAAARAADHVDHAAVAALKWPVLAALHRSFAAHHLGPGEAAATARGEGFRRFQRAGGAMLAAYATFTALHQRLHETAGFSWRNWPAPLRDAASDEVQSFAADHRAEIELYQYLEWEGDRQFAAAAARGAGAGLEIGLYRDLAVGVDPSGAEAWADPAMLSPDATVGAPPDILNLKGQDWGLSPVNPVMLRRRAYAPFIAALRANMRHAGVLRIDHAMALKQLYWVPRGAGPEGGAYVAYPFDDLLGILALESERNRCAVIGEDLGTIPPGFSQRLNEASVLSYRVLLFERAEDGGFLPPRDYLRPAAATFSTHDIATLEGYWMGRDIAWRRRLDLYPSAVSAEADLARRRVDRRLLLDALLAERVITPAAARRLLPHDDTPSFAPELAAAVNRFLGRTPSALVLLQIEDALGESEQVNLPGTVDEHPNWRRKLSRALEAIGRDDDVSRVTEALDEARKERPA